MQYIITIIGSRTTPDHILKSMTVAGQLYAQHGWVLRSGGANGADSAGELAFADFPEQKEIYLPWKGFNNNSSKLYGVCGKALEIAEKYHPNWNACKDSVRKLHGRNVYQVLGKNLDRPSDLLLCWTEGGKDVGGTATAIKMARDYGVPIINLGVM